MKPNEEEVLMVTKVYVWDTKANIFYDDMDFEDHGHSAALVKSTYVSFWPSDDSGTRPKKAKISSRTPYYVKSYEEDCSKEAMKRRADHVIELRNLDEQSMLSFWREIKAKQNSFHFLDSNCSTVVGRMLLRGGWDPFEYDIGTIFSSLVQALKSEVYYWEPNDVLDLARRIRDTIG